MQSIHKALASGKRPGKMAVVQFGEGNFLRAFVDAMLDEANERLALDMGVTVVQPIANGLVDRLLDQDGLYTLILRGKVDGRTVRKTRVIRSVIGGVNPYADFDAYLATARNPDLRLIVSNTTEAGIVYTGEDRLEDRPQASFPGKLTRFLYERWNAGLPGLTLLPCELIDANGDALRACVLKTAAQWALPEAFTAWLADQNIFANTLVDRIVTGFPKDEAETLWAELGYRDELLDVGEPFGLWVIEGPESIAELLPLDKAGLPVIFTRDVTPYKQRKVRMLNGAHTALAPAAYLAGLNTVDECMADPLTRAFLMHVLEREILPTLSLDRKDLEDFIKAMVERFENPFNKHRLLSITLNSCAKFTARIVPTIQAYRAAHGAVPPALSFSLAALIALYRAGGRPDDADPVIQDDAYALSRFAALRDAEPDEAVRQLLGDERIWGMDLSSIEGLTQTVQKKTRRIQSLGIAEAMAALMREVRG